MGIPTEWMPNWMWKILARMDDPFMGWIASRGVRCSESVYDGSKIQRELGFEYQYSAEEALIAAAESMIAFGLAEKGPSPSATGIYLLVIGVPLAVVGLVV